MYHSVGPHGFGSCGVSDSWGGAVGDGAVGGVGGSGAGVGSQSPGLVGEQNGTGVSSYSPGVEGAIGDGSLSSSGLVVMFGVGSEPATFDVVWNRVGLYGVDWLGDESDDGSYSSGCGCWLGCTGAFSTGCVAGGFLTAGVFLTAGAFLKKDLLAVV